MRSRTGRSPGPRARGFACALLVLLAATIAGCDGQPYVTPERLDRGLVIVLTGIEGRSPLNEAICDGLAVGGIDWAIELRDWTSWWGPLYSLRAEKRNREEARDIANRIVRYRMSFPDRPVVLVGQSGGGAMAVWAAEEMPPGEHLDGLVLLAPTLSPGYMLDAAIPKSRRGIVSFCSSRDWFILGLGTTFSGTMDGEYDSAAGNVGFEVPVSEERAELYRKLYQVSWTARMAYRGHLGIHLTSGAVRFVSTYVAPLVLAEEWNVELLQRVIEETKAEDTSDATAEP